METPFQYSTTYSLDKSHFSETFDESMPSKRSMSEYFKAIALVLFGAAILVFTSLSGYAAWFIIVLGIVDALGVYFKKPWWLARQMISRAANTKLTLSIDEEGISSRSTSISSNILWADIQQIEKTKRGWMLHHSAGRHYLSDRCLSDEASAFIKTKASQRSVHSYKAR
ncbi:YcxB family protein [Ningiella sp. W23]|uniref:YcxB family protein n=1 Tax=Ningiella sp. W23 TaxID=3023715 RepID=UPI003757197E